MQNKIDQFEVFFDGQCPLCSREIELIRRKDKTNRLKLTDISRPNFSSDDFSNETLMREIHGRLPNGDYVKGVEVFREIYQRLGFSKVVAPTRLPGVRHLLDFGYRCFAFLRFRHAKHRLKKFGLSSPATGCSSGTCQAFNSSSKSGH